MWDRITVGVEWEGGEGGGEGWGGDVGGEVYEVLN